MTTKLDAQNGLGVVASGALAGFLYLQRREQAAAQAAADAQLANQRASLEALRSQARVFELGRTAHATLYTLSFRHAPGVSFSMRAQNRRGTVHMVAHGDVPSQVAEATSAAGREQELAAKLREQLSAANSDAARQVCCAALSCLKTWHGLTCLRSMSR